MIKAYAYVRFSTIQQSKGHSLERQMKLTNEFVSKHDLILDDTLSMKDLGLSAYKRKNITKGALGAFIKAVESGVVEKGSYLLVESLDRISRAEVTEQMQLFLTLINADITIVTLLDGFIYKKESIDRQMSDLSYSLMIMSRGHEESKTKSERVAKAWEEKRKEIKTEIYTSIRPAWLDIDKDENDFIANEEKSIVVKKIFEMAEKGFGKDRIAKHLNSSGIKTFGRSKHWHQSYIQKILQNRSVIGEFQPHRMLNGKRVPEGSPIQDYFPRIVTDEQFYSILRRRNSLAKVVGRARTSNRNLFTGLLKCGYTGCSVVYVNKGKWQYLVSSNAMFGKNDIPYTSWAYKDFETSFFSLIKDLDISSILNPNSKMISSQYEAEALKLEEENKLLNKNIKNLVDFISDGKAPRSIKEEIVSLEEELERNKIKVDNIKKLLSNNIEIAKATEDSQKRTIELLDKLDEPEIREEIRILINQQVTKIEIFAGGKQVRKSLGNSFADMFFLSTPILTKKEKEEIKNGNHDIFDKIAEGWNDSLRAKGWDEEEQYNAEDTEDDEVTIPTDRKSRFFVVHFKTGVIRYVMPSVENPKKGNLAFSFDEDQIGKTGFMIDLGLGN